MRFIFVSVRALPPLSHLVGSIVGVRTETKVLRVNTGRIIAGMQNTNVFWDILSGSERPRNTVGQPFFPSAIRAKQSVARLQFTGSPQPAIIIPTARHFGPEPIFN
jgi:hypothetical protein